MKRYLAAGRKSGGRTWVCHLAMSNTWLISIWSMGNSLFSTTFKDYPSSLAFTPLVTPSDSWMVILSVSFFFFLLLFLSYFWNECALFLCTFIIQMSASLPFECEEWIVEVKAFPKISAYFWGFIILLNLSASQLLLGCSTPTVHKYRDETQCFLKAAHISAHTKQSLV